MLRVVFDSTVLVSAFLTQKQLSAQLLSQARRGVFSLYLSEAIVSETQQTLLESEHIRKRYVYPDESVFAFTQGLRAAVHLVSDPPVISGVVRDPNDDMVIACAVAAQATYLVARDKDLLSLNHYQGIPIVTPEAFMQLLREQSTTT